MHNYLQKIGATAVILLVYFTSCKSGDKSTFENRRAKAWKIYEQEQKKKRKMASKAFKMHRKHQGKPMRKQMKKDVKKLRRDRRRNRRKYG